MEASSFSLITPFLSFSSSLFFVHREYTTSKPLKRERTPAFEIHTNVMHTFAKKNPAKCDLFLWFSSSQKSCPALSPLTSESLALGPKVHKGLQTHTAAAAPPRCRGQTVGSTGAGHWREETHTHTTHRLTWITNHQHNDSAHFNGTVADVKGMKRHPCAQASHTHLCVRCKDF